MKKFSLIIVAQAVMVTACTGNRESEQREKVIPVKVITVAPTTAVAERSYVGTVEESFALGLSFTGNGTVESVYVVEGQQVAKGQLLAVLSNSTAQNSVDVAEASLRQAEDAYGRMKKLHDNGSLPDIKFVEVETGLQQAKALAAVARKNLADCRLHAPRSGVIAKRSIEPGANILPGISAFKLITMDKVDVKVSVPENEISSTAFGQTATVEIPALDGETFTGKVTTKGVSANALSHTYEVRIGLENTRLQLMPGMVCKVRLQSGSQTAGIVTPYSAVQVTHDGRRFVWITDGNTVQRRFVETGALSSRGIEILSGLSAGDLLVVEGGAKVSEGMKVLISKS
ncbi:MAG: efflux RND transporter periplasmic adaptor subunit [Tannerella sp.]|jgi:RND family efflux transporter MFP subunit|nr:efflux RND transporter periplasmic adaptor subunit [Tannerella sp.]